MDRLTELTSIKNDFDDATRGERRASGGRTTGRIEQLSADRARVMDARADEISRLMQAGHTAEELTAHLNRTDRHR